MARLTEGQVRFLAKPVSDRRLATVREVVGTYGALSRMELAATDTAPRQSPDLGLGEAAGGRPAG